MHFPAALGFKFGLNDAEALFSDLLPVLSAPLLDTDLQQMRDHFELAEKRIELLEGELAAINPSGIADLGPCPPSRPTVSSSTVYRAHAKALAQHQLALIHQIRSVTDFQLRPSRDSPSDQGKRYIAGLEEDIADLYRQLHTGGANSPIYV